MYGLLPWGQKYDDVCEPGPTGFVRETYDGYARSPLDAVKGLLRIRVTVRTLLTRLSACWIVFERALDKLDRLWIGVIAIAAAAGFLSWLAS